MIGRAVCQSVRGLNEAHGEVDTCIQSLLLLVLTDRLSPAFFLSLFFREKKRTGETQKKTDRQVGR